MGVSIRSILIAGVSTVAVTSVAVAPVRPVPEPRDTQISAPVQLSAAVTPLPQPDIASALAEISVIADELDLTLAAADVTAQNAASDFVDWVYQGIVEWADYFALELAPWALGWIPLGNLITDQIYALYPPIIDFTDSIVYDLVDPVLNDPLNLAVWANGLSAVAYTAVASLINAGINEINLVIDYFLGWLPPLPPIPPWPPFPVSADATPAATADLMTPQALPGPIAGPIAGVSDIAAGIAHTLVNLWYPPSGLIDSGVGLVSGVLDGFSWLPLVGVADFQLNEIWGLIHTGGNTLAEFGNDLIDIANGLVANTVEDGLAPALEDAFYTGLLSVQTHGGAAADAVRNFTLDQLQYLTGVWVPHTTSPRVDLPQGPPDTIRFAVPRLLHDVLGPLAGLLPSGTLGSAPLDAALTAPEADAEVVGASTRESAPDAPERTEPDTGELTGSEDTEPTNTDTEDTEPTDTDTEEDAEEKEQTGGYTDESRDTEKDGAGAEPDKADTDDTSDPGDTDTKGTDTDTDTKDTDEEKATGGKPSDQSADSGSPTAD
jgi:hypothetical protein